MLINQSLEYLCSDLFQEGIFAVTGKTKGMNFPLRQLLPIKEGLFRDFNFVNIPGDYHVN